MDEVLGREHPDQPAGPVIGSAGGLALEGVTRRYPGAEHASVDDVSLEIPAGELLALVGASGSGKTTTLRIAAGYEPADAGRVMVTAPDGTRRDITREPPQRRQFGMVFQHYALFPHMSVLDNVAFGLEARGVAKAERRARAQAALDGVGLGDKSARAVQALSGGEQQRVALARALVIEPRVLLLDEPLSNLDPTLRQSMRDDLRRMLRSSGVTALFVTHDQEDAFAVADRVAMLSGGRLLQVGTPETLYREPATREVAEFVGRATLVPARRLEGRLAIGEGPVTLHADSPGEDATLLAVLRPESLMFTGASERAWAGTVRERRFAGGHAVYRVALESGPVVELSTPASDIREGDTVHVALAARHVATVAA